MLIDLPAAARAQGMRRSKPLPLITTTQEQRNRLYRCYAPVVEAWRVGAREQLLPVYGRTITSITDSIPEYEQAEANLAEQIARLVLNITATGGVLDAWAVSLEQWHRRRFVAGALSASGVDLSAMIGPADARLSVEQSIAWNTSLIRDVSDETRRRVANAFFAGFQARTPARELGKQIDAAAGLGRKRSARIAADQTVKLAASLDAERQRSVGIVEWVWRHSGKAHPRLDHVARNLKHYGDTAAIAREIGVLPPPADLPGQLPYCGCVRQSFLRLDED